MLLILPSMQVRSMVGGTRTDAIWGNLAQNIDHQGCGAPIVSLDSSNARTLQGEDLRVLPPYDQAASRRGQPRSP